MSSDERDEQSDSEGYHTKAIKLWNVKLIKDNALVSVPQPWLYGLPGGEYGYYLEPGEYKVMKYFVRRPSTNVKGETIANNFVDTPLEDDTLTIHEDGSITFLRKRENIAFEITEMGRPSANTFVRWKASAFSAFAEGTTNERGLCVLPIPPGIVGEVSTRARGETALSPPQPVDTTQAIVHLDLAGKIREFEFHVENAAHTIIEEPFAFTIHGEYLQCENGIGTISLPEALIGSNVHLEALSHKTRYLIPEEITLSKQVTRIIATPRTSSPAAHNTPSQAVTAPVLQAPIASPELAQDDTVEVHFIDSIFKIPLSGIIEIRQPGNDSKRNVTKDGAKLTRTVTPRGEIIVTAQGYQQYNAPVDEIPSIIPLDLIEPTISDIDRIVVHWDSTFDSSADLSTILPFKLEQHLRNRLLEEVESSTGNDIPPAVFDAHWKELSTVPKNIGYAWSKLFKVRFIYAVNILHNWYASHVNIPVKDSVAQFLTAYANGTTVSSLPADSFNGIYDYLLTDEFRTELAQDELGAEFFTTTLELFYTKKLTEEKAKKTLALRLQRKLRGSPAPPQPPLSATRASPSPVSQATRSPTTAQMTPPLATATEPPTISPQPANSRATSALPTSPTISSAPTAQFPADFVVKDINSQPLKKPGWFASRSEKQFYEADEYNRLARASLKTVEISLRNFMNNPVGLQPNTPGEECKRTLAYLATATKQLWYANAIGENNTKKNQPTTNLATSNIFIPLATEIATTWKQTKELLELFLILSKSRSSAQFQALQAQAVGRVREFVDVIARGGAITDQFLKEAGIQKLPSAKLGGASSWSDEILNISNGLSTVDATRRLDQKYADLLPIMQEIVDSQRTIVALANMPTTPLPSA